MDSFFLLIQWVKRKCFAYTDAAIAAIAGGLHYKGSVATVADLPENAEVGDCYTVLANGHEYVWDGTQWVDLSSDLDNYVKKSGDTITGNLTVQGSLTATLTGNVTGNLTGNVTGNVTGDLTGTADKATKDADGNVIPSTYVKKADIGTLTSAEIKTLFVR